MTTDCYRVIEYHMKGFPKIRDPGELKYIDLLNFYSDVKIWERKIRDLIAFDKEHTFDIMPSQVAGGCLGHLDLPKIGDLEKE